MVEKKELEELILLEDRRYDSEHVWARINGEEVIIENNPAEIDPRNILGPTREAAVEVIRGKIRLFGSSGKA